MAPQHYENMNGLDVHIGARIRLRRRLQGLSQQALANALGVSFQQVQKYERGANRVSASSLWHIAKTLEVPITFFFEGLEQNDFDAGQTAIVIEFLQSPDGVSFAEALTQIRDNRIRRSLLAVIRTYVKIDIGGADEETPPADALSASNENVQRTRHTPRNDPNLDS